MTKWILCIATFLCLGIAVHNTKRKRTHIRRYFPNRPGDRRTDHGLAAGLGHNPVSVTGFCERTKRETTVWSAGSSVYLC